MKKYRITLSGENLNEYIQGTIGGILWVLTGMPKISYPWGSKIGQKFARKIFKCTEDQYKTATDVICKRYGNLIKIEFEEI